MKKKKWYLANLITYPIFSKDKKTLNSNYYMYWDNLVLVEAVDSSEAYRKALKFGKAYKIKYKNSDGENIDWKFAGVRELVEIYNSLQDGEEIAYSEGFCKKESNVFKMIPEKNSLGIFKLEKGKRLSKKSKIKTQ